MEMFNPSHPGEILLDEILPNTLNMTITDFAKHLGFSRETISKVLHGKAPISPTLAWRLELAGISTARMWLSLQSQYDLWQIKHKSNQPEIIRLVPCIDEDEDILRIAEDRLRNPGKIIEVNVDDL
ncbi:HigA family addiction module antitoxin [Gilliamella sp. ESL0232]|uniref:HigA family addiction module antitoxin n=1 Tax=unclassified Gilliamella TaxID=2685620 RepID=UPI001580A9A8|nr:HigA family addiction module antitoxin [Gilliamella sp. ESL0232]NUE95310.1 HigA family addiction module antidote protein [Gilliamella sp. ESL0232]